VLCPACAPPGSRPLDASVLALLGQLAGIGWDGLDAAAAEPRARRVAAALVHSFLTYHLERPLRAWELVPR